MFIYSIKDIVGLICLGVMTLLLIGFFIYVCYCDWRDKHK